MMDNGRVQLLVFQAEGDPRPHRRPVRPDGVEVSCLDACPTPEHRELIDAHRARLRGALERNPS
jgi:hypothetical protein